MFNLQDGLWKYIYENHLGNTMDYRFMLLASGFTIIAILAGYLLGSINSAVIVSRLLYRDDIRRYGSGNAGLTNMLRTYGKGAAGLTLLGDFAKTALSVFIGGVLGGFGYMGLTVVDVVSLGGIANGTFPLTFIAGFFSVIGHIYPIYHKFKGGKGVLCTFVMAAILSPIDFCIIGTLWIIVVAISKYVSLASVISAILYPVILNGHIKLILGAISSHNAANPENQLSLPAFGVTALISILIAIMVVYFHRENLKRISNGTERKFSIGGKGKKKEENKENTP